MGEPSHEHAGGGVSAALGRARTGARSEVRDSKKGCGLSKGSESRGGGTWPKTPVRGMA